MLPPPITSPTLAPILEMSLISVASRLRISKSKPVPFCPARASPDSFSNTRLYLSSGKGRPVEDGFSLLFAHLKANEASHLNVLPDLCRRFLDQLANGLLRLADPRLVHQGDILVVRLYLTRNNLLDKVIRLAALPYLLEEDATLLLPLPGGTLFLVAAAGRAGAMCSAMYLTSC